jgi:hypothetical protein
MKTPKEVEAFLLAKAHEIFDEGFRDGYEHGLMTFGQVPPDQHIWADRVQRVEGTPEAPESETWDDMQRREARDGAILLKAK